MENKKSTTSEKILNINFKKAFTIFFSALLVFGIVSVSYSAVTGGWDRAMSLEQSRIEFRQGSGNVTAQDVLNMGGRGGGRLGFGRSNQRQFAVISGINETDNTINNIISPRATMTRNPGDRILGSFARFGSRITTGQYDIFNFTWRLFLLAFNLLLAAWVYVDSKKLGKNKIFWGVLTLFTSVFGWVIYLIARENNRHSQTA